MQRRTTIIIIAALLLIALPLIALWTLGHSESALRFVMAKIPSRFGTIERISIRDVQGSLADGVTIGVIDIEHDVVHIRLRDIRIRIDLLPLLWQAVEAREFRVGRVEIDQQVRDRPPPDKPPRFLPQLITVRAITATLPSIVIQPLTGNAVEFRDTELDGLLRSTTLSVRKLSTRLGNLHLEADGLLSAALPLGIEGRATARFQPKRGPAWLAKAEFDGDLEDARFDATMREPFDVDIDEGKMRLLSPWSVRADAKVGNLDLQAFGGSAALGLIGGELVLTIDRNGYRAAGRLLPPGLAAGPLDVAFDGRYSQSVVTAKKIGLAHLKSGAAIDAAGTITFTDAGPALDLQGRWQRFRWPLTDDTPSIASDRGDFTIEGLASYAVTARGPAKIAALPPLDAEVTATLSPGKFTISRVLARTLGGVADLKGEFTWRPAERWQLDGNVRGIDPAQWRAGLPGKIDFQLNARGNGLGARGVIDVDVQRLSGRLRGAAARGSGRLIVAGDKLQLRKVDVSAGGLRLALDGTLSSQRNEFDFKIDAQDLGVIAEGGKGRLIADGTLRGTPTAMRVRLEARGSELGLGGVAVRRLVADVDLDPSGGANATASAHIEAEDVNAVGRQADRVVVDITGRSSAHTLAVDIAGKDLSISARGEASFDAAGWRQRWSNLVLRLNDDIRLSLEQALGLQLTTQSVRVDPFCLRGTQDSALTAVATICGSGAWNGDDWKLEATVSKLPIASLLPRPAARAEYQGSLNAAIDLRALDDSIARGSVRADFSDAALLWQRASGKRDLIPLGSGSLLLESNEAGIDGKLEMAAGERGWARGKLRAARTAASSATTASAAYIQNWRDMSLTATLRADSTALALLYLYVPDIDRSAGELSLDLLLGGTLGTPLVNGVLRLEKGELDFYQVNLALRDIRAEARLLDNGFVLESSARAGKGRIDATAELTWRGGQPYGELQLHGDNLLIIDVPEARISASPNLSFKVAGRDLAATGTVNIPEARIVPADLTGAALTSADEALVNAEPRDLQSSFRVSSNLRLTLGDRVNLDSFGLSGRLAGALNVITSADGVNRGSGELGIVEGKYAALGRRLDIERGRLIFSGGLLGDPGVDLRATKEFPDVKAGVNVRGTLREPRMTFFSEPSLPQSQVVSLILAGGTLETAQSSNIASSGRDAILAQGGAILAQQLGQRIGIEDVGIEQNLANETSLVFGKYLSSRLYVSYGVSLAEAINTLKLRYSINDRWTLRTEAGKEASAEIVYTVEKN